jgi:glutaconate CoA-transferase subunit A
VTGVPVLDPDEAVDRIPDGACIGVGGSVNAAHPMALVRALIRARRTGLTAVGLTGGLDLDMLVGSGSVSTLSAAYVGAEGIVGLPPAIRWAAEEGRLEVWESDEGVHLASLRARAQKLPYQGWSGSLGTAVTAHPLVEEAVDEASGARYLKVRPLRVDFALLWAEAADAQGNLLLAGPDFGDEALRNAADVRIVQVERIVPTAAIARHPDRVVPWGADVLVRSPLSTHPFSGSSIRIDESWIGLYADAVSTARKAGSVSALERFFDGWHREVEGEDGYFARLGVARMRELLT